MNHGYLLDNRATEAGTRFAALSALFNPWTFRHIEDLGIAPGWRCWEVGAGGPTVPRWLAERVGRGGHVLVTDIDLSWVQDMDAPIELRCHDVGRDAMPPGRFDLIHARLVLVHVPEREMALRQMAAVLRPGGWLLVEDADPAMQPLGSPDACGPEQELANTLRQGFRALMSERGVDLAYGRKLPRLLRQAGLTEVGADAYFPVAHPATAVLEMATIELLHESLVAKGHATAEQIDHHLANVEAGRLDLTTAPMISAWGRRAY